MVNKVADAIAMGGGGIYKKSVIAGFASGASGSLSGASEAGGDCILSVTYFPTPNFNPTDITIASCSLTASRLKVVNTSTTNGKLEVFWWDRNATS